MGTSAFCLHPQGFEVFLNSAQVLACGVICAYMKDLTVDRIVVSVLYKLWHPFSDILDLGSWKAAYLTCLPARLADGRLSAS